MRNGKDMKKRFGTLAGSLLLGSLMAGCGAEPAPEQVAGQVRQSAEAPAPSAPVLENLEFIPSQTPSAFTPGLLRARLAQGEQATQIDLTGDDGKPLALRDDGLNGDEKAGDGLFSGFGVVDLDEHRKTQERIATFQKETTEPLTVATFDDRVLVRESPLSPLPADIFAPGRIIPLPITGIARAVNPSKSLIITHPSVVGDPTRTWDPCTGTGNPNGVWTFKHLMTEMANTTAPAPFFTERWLQQWLANQTVNGRTVPARGAMATQILNAWPRLSTGELDLNRSPFKLVAIVNRADLGRGNGGPYGTSGAGELRFVFSVMTSQTCLRPYNGFLVIFEYGVPKPQCAQVKSWAQSWMALSNPLLALGSSAYNTQLQSLTQQVVLRNAAPNKPNGSAINQVRTNEIMLSSPWWEMREFRLFSTAANPRNFTVSSPAPGHLVEHVTVRTPFDMFNNSATLTNFLTANNAAILAGTHDVPLDFGATLNFLGAFPQMPTPSFIWNAPNLSTVPNGFTARHKFSLNTCTGCHAGETATQFTHVGVTGGLSPFLATGMTNMNTPYNVTDPVSGQVRSFFEIRERAQHLDSAANQSCVIRRFDRPVFFPH
ncbi:MAG TPA: choice-of-anchor X domain-containing protein [Archangium sp.]|uniref:choice-of-anchor X domain-containing protein n=1 Tax=Archangium sp. TaxID=1872627 RepID=UPI002E329106|nr:choice-of-anchor X domain-containing protein [Archangium sp.]HEX5753595.1 choice-of-anchor X domain-containing protein [Archangium sp.]